MSAIDHAFLAGIGIGGVGGILIGFVLSGVMTFFALRRSLQEQDRT